MNVLRESCPAIILLAVIIGSLVTFVLMTKSKFTPGCCIDFLVSPVEVESVYLQMLDGSISFVMVVKNVGDDPIPVARWELASTVIYENETNYPYYTSCESVPESPLDPQGVINLSFKCPKPLRTRKINSMTLTLMSPQAFTVVLINLSFPAKADHLIKIYPVNQ